MQTSCELFSARGAVEVQKRVGNADARGMDGYHVQPDKSAAEFVDVQFSWVAAFDGVLDDPVQGVALRFENILVVSS